MEKEKIKDTDPDQDYKHFLEHGWSFSIRNGQGIYISREWIELAEKNALIT